MFLCMIGRYLGPGTLNKGTLWDVQIPNTGGRFINIAEKKTRQKLHCAVQFNTKPTVQPIIKPGFFAMIAGPSILSVWIVNWSHVYVRIGE